MTYSDWGYVTLCAAAFILSNVGTKLSLTVGQEWIMYPVYVLACVAFWLFRKLCIGHGLAVSSGIVDSIITIGSIAIGLLVLHEILSLKQYIGLALILVGLILVR